MKEIIKNLECQESHERRQIGLTPRTNFKGSQEDHDNMHRKRAAKLHMAICILKNATVMQHKFAIPYEIMRQMRAGADTLLYDTEMKKFIQVLQKECIQIQYEQTTNGTAVYTFSIVVTKIK